MIPFGPKPIPKDRWFESKPFVGENVDSSFGRDDERPARVRRYDGNVRPLRNPYLSTTADSLFAGKPARLPDFSTGTASLRSTGAKVDWEALVTKVSASPGVPLTFDCP